MAFDLSEILYKKELNAVEKFKLKSLILSRLGPNALRIYNLVDGTKSASQIIQLLDLEEKEVLEHLEIFHKMGLIYSEKELANKTESVDENAITQSTEESPTISPSSEENLTEKKEMEKVDISQLQQSSTPTEDLSEAEKAVFEKFGEVGLKVFSMIDGYRSAQEIMEEAGINEFLLIEILEFLNQKGFITLETKEEPKGTKKEKKTESHDPVSPIIEKDATPPVFAIEQSYQLYVPQLKKLSIVELTKLKLALKFKYKLGGEFLNYLNGSYDAIDLFFIFDLPFEKLVNILKELRDEGYLTLTPLSRAEIEKKYGTIALAAYKKFGIDGLLIYNFIGKSVSIVELLKKSKIEAKKASEILVFLSDILGLDLKINKEKLFQALEQKTS
ncbi:MAG: hypothetical protein N3D10_02700 [Candidatus Micrarchaeota archaeon]|nr:hypothetical protein [Candidatus Micrarchaeota archaeon]